MAKWLLKVDPIILGPWFRWVALIVALCMLLGCAAKSRVGPCTMTACGWECCNNDAKRCPPCWEKK